MTLAIAIAFAAVASVLVGIALRVVFKGISPASVTDYRPCKGGWSEAFLNHCESGLLRVPQQPINTYTNVAYIAGGFFLVFYINTLPSYVLSLALLYLCVGSALYHATSTRWAGSLDASSMYAVFSALTVQAILMLFQLEESVVALIMFVVAILCAYFLRYRYRGNMSLKIGIFLVLTYAFTIWAMVRNGRPIVDGYLIASFILFALAYLAWNIDKHRSFPLRGWGHGFWHVLTGIAIALLSYATYAAQ